MSASKTGLIPGSSPLARGTHLESRLLVMASRLIPARAGNTSFLIFSTSIDWAHPRSRGEHACMRLVEATFLGSSPLARGTPAQFHGATARYGLIPARAGNTSFLAPGFSGVWAHPRSRGEHFDRCTGGVTVPGSSPLARGTRAPLRVRSVPHGLIPARAGNT